jgi:ABC-type nitrate/sulfonate/bicarbonate transport system permease component
MWALSRRQLVALQAAALLAACLGVLCALRATLQRYLDTAFVAWYSVKHGGMGETPTL